MLPKRVRQFIMNLTDRINEDDYKYDADAYVAAWQNAYDKVSRWFDSENPLQSMHNFAQDLSSNGIANITYDANGALMEVTPTFKNTAEAADKLGVSVNAVETAMSKLEEYGFEFDDVMFSGKGLEDYKTSLEGIRSICALNQALDIDTNCKMLGIYDSLK